VVVVFTHDALPTADLASRDAAFRECLRRADDEDDRFARRRLESLESLPAPLAGVRSFAWRSVADVELRKPLGRRRYLEYEDVLGFLYGHAEVVLRTESRGSPFPAPEQHELLALLYSRATKAKAP
jgi:hypothetical protein